MGSRKKPGGFAKPDNQGKCETCTRYAMAKCVCNGFMTKKFVQGHEIDIDQEKITEVLLNEHKVYIYLQNNFYHISV